MNTVDEREWLWSVGVTKPLKYITKDGIYLWSTMPVCAGLYCNSLYIIVYNISKY